MGTVAFVIVVVAAFGTGGVVAVSCYLYYTEGYKKYFSHRRTDSTVDGVYIAVTSNPLDGDVWSTFLKHVNRHVIVDKAKNADNEIRSARQKKEEPVGDEQLFVLPPKKENGKS